MSLDDFMQTMNLDFQESKIYVLLLTLGQISFGEIIQLTEFTSEDTLRSLEGLKQKGYVVEVPGISNRYQALIPFAQLETSAKDIITQAENITGQLDEYIGEKLGTILSQLREESQKITNGLNTAQATVKQAEMKGEGDTEARIARYTLEVEQETDQTKADIIQLFQGKQTEHAGILEQSQDQMIQNTHQMDNTLKEVNQTLKTVFETGLTELQDQEKQRNEVQANQLQELVTQTQTALSTGIQNVHSTLTKAGETLTQSIEGQKDGLSSYLTQVSDDVEMKVTQVSDHSKTQITSYLQSNSEAIQNQMEFSKTSTVEVLTNTKNGIKNQTNESLQNLQQTLTGILTTTQTQLNSKFQQAQETLALLTEEVGSAVSQAKNQINTNVGQFSDTIGSQIDINVEKAVSNTIALHEKVIQDTQLTNDSTSEKIQSSFGVLLESTNNALTEIRGNTEQGISTTIETLRREINTQVEGFGTTLAPQEQSLQEELIKFKSSVTSSQSQTLDVYLRILDEFKETIGQRHQETHQRITEAVTGLQGTINQLMEQIQQQFTTYDQQFADALTNSAVKNSHIVIAQTQELKDRTLAVVNELADSATQSLTETSDLISSSLQAEITTFETGFTDFTVKFQDVTQKTDQMFNDYLGSLQKLSALTEVTKRPTVQTAPIISKEATLDYLRGMFSRMKGGLTLLIPNPADIPVEQIMATKPHQRIQLVSIIDPDTHHDLLMQLFQKPNVRVRRVDPARFPGVERNIAADRDGEEVIIGVVEDSGQTVSVVSESEAFIQLMGKIVIGGTFLAQSTEISRSQVGM